MNSSFSEQQELCMRDLHIEALPAAGFWSSVVYNRPLMTKTVKVRHTVGLNVYHGTFKRWAAGRPKGMQGCRGC